MAQVIYKQTDSGGDYWLAPLLKFNCTRESVNPSYHSIDRYHCEYKFYIKKSSDGKRYDITFYVDMYTKYWMQWNRYYNDETDLKITYKTKSGGTKTAVYTTTQLRIFTTEDTSAQDNHTVCGPFTLTSITSDDVSSLSITGLVVDFTKTTGTNGKPGIQHNHSTNWDSSGIPGNWINATWSGEIVFDGLEPLLEPPAISNITNTNPYNKNMSISNSTNSISLSWTLSGGSDITSIKYKIGSNDWISKSGTTSIELTGLTPGTSYNISIKCSNEAGDGNTLSITIRTRHNSPVVTLNLKSRDLEALTFNWTSDKDLESSQYKIDNGSWIDLKQTGKSGSFTASWFDPKTTHTIYFKGVSTSTYDSLNSNEVNSSGTTYDKAKITSIGNCIFGQNIQINAQSESTKQLKLQIWTNGNNKKPIFEFDNINISSGSYTFSPTQSQLDDMYKCFTNLNYVPIYFLLITKGDWKNWNDTTQEKQLQLTGIAKTAHIGISNNPKRSQCFFGINNTPKKAVAWIGDNNNKPRRCI